MYEIPDLRRWPDADLMFWISLNVWVLNRLHDQNYTHSYSVPHTGTIAYSD